MKGFKVIRKNRAGRHTGSRAFTLIELLAVIAIVGILAAILVPLLVKVRKTARDTECISDLRNLSIAVSLYAQDHQNRLPKNSIQPTETTPASNWVFLLSGFPKHETDYLGISYNGGRSIINISSGRKSILLCQQNILNAGVSDSPSATTYGMNSSCSELQLNYASHPAKTCLMVECKHAGIFWPLSTNNGSSMSVTTHGDHSNVLYLDGHVESRSTIPDASETSFWQP